MTVFHQIKDTVNCKTNHYFKYKSKKVKKKNWCQVNYGIRLSNYVEYKRGISVSVMLKCEKQATWNK